MLFATLSALSLASAAAAQVVVNVGVNPNGGGAALQYSPSSILAANGTVVTFDFSGVPGNHTVTQSSFSDPCNPLGGGFDSGFVQILSPVSTTPQFNITITDDSKPIWYHCKQLKPSPHCIAGMVGAINAPTTGNTFAAFQTAAKSFRGLPGQGVGNLAGVGASASAPVGPIESGVTTFGSPHSGAASATGSGTLSPTSTGSASASATATPPALAPAPPVSAASTSNLATSPTSSSAAPPSTSSATATSNGVAGSVISLLAAALGFAML